jgi:hypothetical protein
LTKNCGKTSTFATRVFAGGLAVPSSATVIDNRGEEAMFTDGPVRGRDVLARLWDMWSFARLEG